MVKYYYGRINMKRITKIFIIIIMLTLILQLTACNSSMKILDKAEDIAKIEVYKTGNPTPVIIEDNKTITELAEFFQDVTVYKEKKTFQEKWNSMGSSSSPKYKSHYYFKVTTKDGLVKKSKEYTVVVGRERTDVTPKVTEKSYTAREGMIGTVSVSAYEYLRLLFI